MNFYWGSYSILFISLLCNAGVRVTEGSDFGKGEIPLTRSPCAIPKLCDSYESYTYPTINKTELFVHLEEVPLSTMCVMLEETTLNPIDGFIESKYPRYVRKQHPLRGLQQSSYKRLEADEAISTSLGPIYDATTSTGFKSRIDSKYRSKLLCYEQLIDSHYLLLSLPFTLSKGQYVVLIYAFDQQKGFHLIQQQYQYVIPAMPIDPMFEDSPVVKIISPGYGALQYEEILVHLFNSFEHSLKQDPSHTQDANDDDGNKRSLPTHRVINDDGQMLMMANMNTIRDNSVLCLHVHSYEQQHLIPDTTAVTTKGSDIIFEPASTFFQFIHMKYFDNDNQLNNFQVPEDEAITVRHVPMTYFNELEVERQVISTLRNGDDQTSKHEKSTRGWKAGRYDQGYIEVVLSDERLAEQRFFMTVYNEKTQSIEWNPQAFENKQFPHIRSSVQRDVKDDYRYVYTEMLRGHVSKYITDKKQFRERQMGFKTLDRKNEKRNKKQEDKINVCIPAGNEMDGQKQIWLQQIEHLNKDRFNFIFLLTFDTIVQKVRKEGQIDEEEVTAQTIEPMTISVQTKSSQTSFYHYLLEHVKKDQATRKGHTNIIIADNTANGYAIPEEEIYESPIEVSEVIVDPQTGISRTIHKTVKLGSVWRHNMSVITEYNHHRYLAAKGDIKAMTPSWSQTLYQHFVNDMLKHDCDVVTLANHKGYSADVSLIDTANYANVPIIAELTNLHIHPDTTPDVIIAPSHQSLFHDTVQEVFQEMKTKSGYKPLGLVISPSVDLKKYDPLLYRTSVPAVPAKSCEVFSPLGTVRKEVPYQVFVNGFYKHRPCVLIGFAARLVPGKNPGLFLQAAYHILQNYPFARFRFIGEGPIKEDLMALAQRLSIDHAIDFIGWVPNAEMPKYLADVDILVNPSLRGWAETFCISNIEAMSMEIPIVTFAVGGIGEYVTMPNITAASQWSITHNAVVVHSANPVALSGAILELVHQPFLAREIGRNARKSVINYFTTARQITQYESLYEELSRQYRI